MADSRMPSAPLPSRAPRRADDAAARPAAARWRFGLGTLLSAVLLASVVFALLGVQIRASRVPQGQANPAVVLLCIALPLGAMLLWSVAGSVRQWLRQPTDERRQEDSPD